MSEDDRRRGSRVWTTLWLAVDGTHGELTQRRVNVSTSGIYFDDPAELGSEGTVHWLHLSSSDRAVTLQMMASVVRVVRGADRARRGSALEFMPESDAAHLELRNFLQYALALATEEIYKRAPRARTIQSLTMVCDWNVGVGVPVRMDVAVPTQSAPIGVEGRTTASKADGSGSYIVEIAVDRQIEGPLKRFSTKKMRAVKVKESESTPPRQFTPARDLSYSRGGAPPGSDPTTGEDIDGIVGGLFDLHARTRPESASHLAGDIARIPLPTLLSMIALESLTGTLTIETDSSVSILIRRGQIVDLDPAPAPAALRAELGRVLGVDKGRFRFNLRDVPTADRVQTSTMSLLLDLARLTDESHRQDVAG